MSPARLPSSPRLPLSRGVSITLQPGQARTLHLPAAGTLRVAQGALWVTRRGRHVDHPAQDLYVSAGLALALDAGDSVVRRPHQTSSQIALWRPSGKRQQLSNQ